MKRIAICTVAMMMSPLSAFAACNSSTMTGTWQMFSAPGNSTLACNISFRAAGAIDDTRSTCTTHHPTFGDVLNIPIDANGKLTVKSDCTVSGSFGISGGSATVTLKEGRLDGSRSTLTTTYITVSDGGATTNRGIATWVRY